LKPFYGITRINSKCINKCLERGGTFCNMPRTEYGVCCKNVKSCRKYDANFCSYDAPKTSKTLQYWTCPHTPVYCGEKEMRVAATYLKTIQPQQDYENWFKNGESCKFKITFPSWASQYDKIAV